MRKQQKTEILSMNRSPHYLRVQRSFMKVDLHFQVHFHRRKYMGRIEKMGVIKESR
jgi:hypothetical protein